jgi:SNF2 family DNA or RNA helicase
MRRFDPSVIELKSMTTPSVPSPAFARPWTPHSGQKIGVKFLLEHAAAGLLADPGVGKTSMVLAAFKVLQKRGLARKMLVIAPLRPAYNVWPGEKDKWKDFNHFRVEVLHGPKKDEALAREADIYVVNYEGLEWLTEATKVTSRSGKTQVFVDVGRFKKLGFDVLVIDELSKFKEPSGVRFKMVKQVLHTFGRRWGLTGSPSANGLMGLFGECYMLDLGRSFGPYITHFRNEYFLPSYNGFGWNLKQGAEKRIYDRCEPLMCRLAAKDFVDMPELRENDIFVDLPPAALKLYRQLEEDMIARIHDKLVTAVNAGALTTKVSQLANGGLYVDPQVEELLKARLKTKSGREWVHVHEAKVEALSDLVDELQGQPLLVGYDFQHDLDRLLKRFGKDTPYIGSGVSPTKGKEIEKLWNAGRIPLLLAQPVSVGHGLNMQDEGHNVAWFGLTYDFEIYDQFNRRIWRQGNPNRKVTVHRLITRGTIDEVKVAALDLKDKCQTGFLDAMNLFRKRS